MMVMVEVMVGAGILIAVWVQVLLGVERWREMTGATRREETKLMITRRRLWGQKTRWQTLSQNLHQFPRNSWILTVLVWDRSRHINYMMLLKWNETKWLTAEICGCMSRNSILRLITTVHTLAQCKMAAVVSRRPSLLISAVFPHFRYQAKTWGSSNLSKLWSSNTADSAETETAERCLLSQRLLFHQQAVWEETPT